MVRPIIAVDEPETNIVKHKSGRNADYTYEKGET